AGADDEREDHVADAEGDGHEREQGDGEVALKIDVGEKRHGGRVYREVGLRLVLCGRSGSRAGRGRWRAHTPSGTGCGRTTWVGWRAILRGMRLPSGPLGGMPS